MTQTLTRAFSALRAREDGQTLVEYALILLLVATTAVAVLSALSAYPPSVFSQVTLDL